MAVLYRKYRPKTFSQVVGQKAIVRTLKNTIVQDRIAHAYVFTGSRGVGKTSLARIFARTLNCTNSKDGEACLKCPICLSFDSNSFLDLIEVDAASNTGVDNVRELIEQVRFQPSMGRFKVFIIDEVHMLSKGAFNALLKTLEEPPQYAVFILATTEISKVPATILSRVQRFDFTRFTDVEIFDHLKYVVQEEKVSVEDAVLNLIVRHSQGGMRDALSLLDKLLSVGDTVSLGDAQYILGVVDIELSRTLLAHISRGDLAGLPSLFDAWVDQGMDFSAFSKDFLEYLRYVLVASLAGKAGLAGSTENDAARFMDDAQAFKTSDLLYIIRLFLRAYKEQNQTPAPELPMLLAACEAALKFASPTNSASSGSTKKILTSNSISMNAQSQDAPIAKKPVLKASRVESVVDTVEHKHVSPPPTFTLEEVQDKWSAVCDVVKVANSPLATLLKNSPPVKVREGIISVEVKYLFHKENLESTKNQLIIAEALTQVIGSPGTIRAEIVKKATEAISDMAAVAQDALRVFGGELVE